MLRSGDLRTVSAHMARHAEESGRGGDPIFAPFEDFDREAYEDKHRTSLRTPSDEPGWERLWGAFEGEHMVGHVNLCGGSLYSMLHRARLGLGVERAHRRKGLGEALMREAIAWARTEGLAWVDLGVFVHNAPARALYEKLGFREVGLTRDAFRVRDTSIDDIAMTLALR
jgi:GNAT superfamily N-acetyltransferase